MKNMDMRRVAVSSTDWLDDRRSFIAHIHLPLLWREHVLCR
jgi:hypothetical protein